MTNMKYQEKNLSDSYKQGVIDAVGTLEKEASYQTWMQNEKFREKFSQRVIDLVTKVRGDSTEE